MNKLLAAAVAVSMLAVAAPASAQSWQQVRHQQYDRYDSGRHDRDWRRGHSIEAELDRLWNRLYAGERSGRLSEREASRYRAGLGDVRRLAVYYSRNGLDRWERADLMRRLDRLDTLMTSDIRDRNNYRG